MATTTISHWRSFREAIMGSPRAPVETPRAPHKVGELVYATVLVESPMVAFKRICGDNISGKEARRNEKQRSNEEDQKIGDKGPRPCVILSTKHHKHNTKIEWEYELCLLTSFGGQAYSQLDGDLKRLALPVCQNSGQPDECADETRIPAFVITPPLKPRANSYLIGCPITRSGRCIVSPGGAAMEPEEVIRLRKYCDWIKRQKREVLKPRQLTQGTTSFRDKIGLSAIQRTDSPLSDLPSGSTGAGPVAGPSGTSSGVEEPTVLQAPKRKSGSGASQIFGQLRKGAENIMKRAESVVSSLSSRSAGSK